MLAQLELEMVLVRGVLCAAHGVLHGASYGTLGRELLADHAVLCQGSSYALCCTTDCTLLWGQVSDDPGLRWNGLHRCCTDQ
jgi:hypothetical protein